MLRSNRAASHNYFLLEKFEAAIALRGTEVKSVRAGRANLKDAYGLVKDGELWLINAHIGPYEHGNIFNHEPFARGSCWSTRMSSSSSSARRSRRD